MNTKVILFMAMTVNGYIAKENGDTPWSDEVWDGYCDFVKKRGNIIVGKRTYEIMDDAGEFKKLANPFTIVVSHSPDGKENEGTVFVSSPRQAIEVMHEKGFKEIVVAGGSELNAGFLKDGLLDEIYLDVEPLIFGTGIRLFAETKAEAKLELIKISKLSKNTLRLHYQVRK